MTISPETHPTLVDIAKRQDPDGPAPFVAEMLSNRIAMLQDAVMVECDDPSRMGNYDIWAEVDRDRVDLKGKVAEIFQEDPFYVECISEKVQAQLVTGNSELYGFPGFYDLYATLASPNVTDGEGTGTVNASVLLVCWHPEAIFGTYLKDTKAGMKIIYEEPNQPIKAKDGGLMLAYQTHCKWRFGLAVRCPRYAVRIANIDKSALGAKDGRDALIDKMSEAMELVPSLKGRCAFYMGKDTRTALHKNSLSTHEFEGIPIRRVHAMDADEPLLPRSGPGT